MTVSTLDYAELSIARTTCQLLAVRGQNLAPSQKGNFPAVHQNILCVSTDDGADSCSEAEDGRIEEISSPVQDSKSCVYIRVWSVCGGS